MGPEGYNTRLTVWRNRPGGRYAPKTGPPECRTGPRGAGRAQSSERGPVRSAHKAPQGCTESQAPGLRNPLNQSEAPRALFSGDRKLCPGGASSGWARSASAASGIR